MKRKRAFDHLDDAHSVLLHIPHASTVIPDRFADLFALDPREVAEELLVMTDHHTDALFELDDADRLVFPVSRLLVDPERFRDDAQEPMSSFGMGVVYTKTHHGRDLKSGSTPLERTLQRRPILGQEECHGKAKEVQRGI